MWCKTKSNYCPDKKANQELTHNISYKDKNEIQRKVINESNRWFKCKEEFNLNNVPSWNRIDYNLSHTLENVVLTCVMYNVERSNRSLELMQTLTQRKQYPIDNHFPLVLTNIHIVEQMQEAIVGGLSNVWHRSNIAGETYISYLIYNYINKKIYNTDTKN
jgi:hypothetical protein